MKPSEALNKYREEIRRVVQSHHAINPRVFGSVLRGEDVEGSDLDLLVDPLPKATLFDLGAIQIELQEKLGMSVDVLTLGDLPQKFREYVLKEATPI